MLKIPTWGDLKAILLAGGYATRLRPISYALPKLLFPLLGKPMIYWTLDLLRSVGVGEVVLGVNYLAETLSAQVGSEYKGMSIKYSLEEETLGTAGPIKLASTNTDLTETFIVMNGDVIAEINLSQMLRQHQTTEALITDALHEVRTPSRFGVVELDSENRIRRFIEKPKPQDAPSRLVNAGIYLIQPDVLKLIAPGRKVSLEREIFPRIAGDGKLRGFPFSGNWFDIGSLSDYRKANYALLQDSTQSFEAIRRNLNIAKDAVIRKPVYAGENSIIESEALVGPKVLLGKDNSIRSGARVSDSILFDKVTVGEGSRVTGAILATGVKVGKRAKIDRGCIISPDVKIGDAVEVGAGAIIHPYKEIGGDVRAAAHVM
jgi:NDP-sugar pyrophosphorylase family protein